MRGALGGPRVLLRRLREVMAEPVSAQERLNKIVVLIAANMVAEVCSIYVLRVDGTLELYATEGPEARGRARHRAAPGRGPRRPGGERGEVAQPLRRAAPSGLLVPPETGEEIYHSFLGVPILRAGNTLGVLVVQNRARDLFGGRGRSAADHRDGARRDHRVGRALRAGQARASSLPRTGRCRSKACRSPTASGSATWCCTSRASSSPS
jgi:hypothetical protein